MDLKTSVLIVSAHGRGHWLAAELHREAIPVVLIDVSPKLGVWPPEDLEGPFGFFKPDELTGSQSDRVFSEDSFESLDRGFTAWLSEGPVEMKSSTTQYRLEKLGQSKEVYETLISSKLSGKNVPAVQKFAADNFERSWLLHLAHQFASTTYVPNARASLSGKALRLMNPFFVRQATRAGQQKMNAWLSSKGVEVMQKTDILDLSFQNKKNISGVELQGETSGVMHLQQIVWMLTSEETYFASPKVAKYLFPEGELEPEWCWVRYRLNLEACQERNSLPLHLLVTENVAGPWTHQNMMVLQRTALEGHFDAWIRIPNVQRFNKEYLRIRGDKVLEIISGRMPLAMPTIQTFPQEFYYTYSQIGPAALPVFAENLESRRHKVNFNNLHKDGSEIWTNYSWEDQFENQTEIRDSLLKWWKMLQLRKEKERRD
ncbi:MAG: hypothetical protein H7326_11210 [Bdellovibrionaceae bacterium]|nr:hypothetical protein [Pseudobdellovibrionaceae bacterium]